MSDNKVLFESSLVLVWEHQRFFKLPFELHWKNDGRVWRICYSFILVLSSVLLFNLSLTLSAPIPQNGQTHPNNSSAFADELFECVWPFCGVGSYRVKKVILDTQADVFCTDVLCDRSEDWLWNFVGRL